MRLFPAILFSVCFCIANAQDTIPIKKRLNLIRYGGAIGYTVGMIGLNEVWYSQSQREPFHFFNDAAEWKQMDKGGHFYNTFQVSAITYGALTWANSLERKRALSSALVGFGILSSIEIFDGFSAGYGASVSDISANAAGSALFWGQMAGWKEIRIHPKYSFSRTSIASQNPDLLGRNLMEEIIKDYNGQTQWLSFDMDKFLAFPKWLNLAVGYGANNMVNARDHQNFDAYRQFYFSLDFDLTAIPTKSRFVKGLIFFANMVKLPAPTIEFSPKGIRGHVLFF